MTKSPYSGAGTFYVSEFDRCGRFGCGRITGKPLVVFSGPAYRCMIAEATLGLRLEDYLLAGRHTIRPDAIQVATTMARSVAASLGLEQVSA